MALSKRLKVVLDTNWYISATINRKSRRRLYSLLIDNRLEILFCQRLLDEYERDIFRKKFEKLIRPDQVYRFIKLVAEKLTAVESLTTVNLSRDVKDNFLLSIAADGSADYLVTGDSDLLVIKEFGKTQIVTMDVFLETLEKL